MTATTDAGAGAGAGAGVATARRPAARRRTAALALAVLALVLAFAGLGTQPLLTKNEGRRAGAIAAMAADGDWLVPHLNGAPYLQKPPLYYWAGLAAARLRGAPDEWSARVPAALAALAMVLILALVLRRDAGPRTALYGALILLVCVAATGIGRRAHIEPLLTALCFGALAAAARYIVHGGTRAWLDLAWGLLGLAVLAKGPVALAFVPAPLLASAVHLRTPRAWQAVLHPRGWALAGLIGGAWYLAVMARLGPDAFAAVAAKDLAGKMWSDHHFSAPWNYLVWLARDFFPASLLVLAAPRRALRTWRSTPLGVLLGYGVLVPALILSLFAYKHAKYLMPAYPALAGLLALHWCAWRAAVPAGARRWAVRGMVALLVGLTVYRVGAEPRVYADRHRGLLALAGALRQAPGPVYAWGELDARLAYYRAAPIPVVRDPATLRALAARGPLRVVVTGERGAELPADLPWCDAGAFSPYLKRGRTARVLGIGAACPNHPVGAGG